MEDQIGDAAGTIWHYLDEHGETTLSKLKRDTKLPEQLVLMGVGWLAKEEKLTFVKDVRTLKVDLKYRL
jgi:Winged helix-turn-helix domain (DUF2582)